SAVFAFQQVDVFSSRPLFGNPLAVVVGADSLSDEQMAAFASWTNLSETSFLLEPKSPNADYRVRIFTRKREVPFAGHPTLARDLLCLVSRGRSSQGQGDRAGMWAGSHPYPPHA